MILERIESFFEWFGISQKRKEELEILAKEAAILAQGMTHHKDYLALAAILENTQPKTIFEIGTLGGVTTDFFLQVLPDVKVVTIAYVNPKFSWFKKKFNNSQLTEKEVGCYIAPKRRDRCTQIIGNSHEIKADEFKKTYGEMDLIFIDGDHSLEGVKQDTKLSLNLISKDGTICWHEANPKERYIPTRKYLESEMEKSAVATAADYIGGIACWNKKIEKKLGVNVTV